MSDINTLVQRYLDIWNETDATARKAAIAEVWATDGSYVDPLAAVSGHDGIEAVVAGAQAQFGGFVFQPLGAVDSHHNTARFSWALVPAAGGDSVVEGFDVAVVEDGRIKSVYGFLDKVPTGA